MGKSRKEWLFAWGMAATALLVRILPWRNSFAGGNIIFGQPDAYYHLRRASIFLKTFPGSPGIDQYMAYPYGAECPWPPLYDLVLAGLAWVIGLGTPTYRILHGVTTLLPPVLAALTVIPVFLLAKRLGGTPAAVAASLVSIVVPGHLNYSIVGSGDHHTAEVLLLVVFLHLFLSSVSSRENGARGSGWRSIMAGAALGTAVLVWQGSIVFGLYLAAGLGLWWLLSGLRGTEVGGEDRPLILMSALRAFVTAAIIVAAGRALYPSDTEQTRFSFGFFSWFQPFFLALLALLVVPLHVAARGDLPGGRRIFVRRLGMAAAAAAGILGILSLFPWFRENVADGVRFLLTRNVYLASINEFQPTFTVDTFRQPLSFGFFLDMIYVALLGLPPSFALVILVRRWRRGESVLEAALFAAWTLGAVFLAVRQKRWANAYAANIAIGAGWIAGAFYEGNRRLQGLWVEFLEWREARAGEEGGDAPGVVPRLPFRLVASPRLSIALSLLLLNILIIPCYFAVYHFLVRPPRPITPDLYNSIVWIRENTPKTKSPWDPRERPEYGILASWDLGHWIQYIGERPTVVNNFGYQLRGEGLEDMLRYFLAKDEDAAVRVCEKRGVRFLFLTDMYSALSSLSPLIGVDFDAIYTGPSVSHGGGDLVLPSDAYKALPYSTMFVFDGASSPYANGLERFRLVFESASDLPPVYLPEGVKEVKVFELVRGARIEGRARPGQRVVLAARFSTNFGRPFEYRRVVEADGRGAFQSRFPYATTASNYAIISESRGLAYTETDAAFFDVSEDDVSEGRVVSVDLRKGKSSRLHPSIRREIR